MAREELARLLSCLLKHGQCARCRHDLANEPAMGGSNQVSNKGLVSYSVSIW